MIYKNDRVLFTKSTVHYSNQVLFIVINNKVLKIVFKNETRDLDREFEGYYQSLSVPLIHFTNEI